MFDIPLPEWFRGFRSSQQEAIEEIVEHFRSGQKVVILQASTGNGKTLIGECVRRILARDPIPVARGEQVEDDTPRCARCHRPLNDEASIARGVGPECAAHIENLPAYVAAVKRARAERRIAPGVDFLPPNPQAHRGMYLCSTKQLQDQMAVDYPEAVVMKGRSNYPTLDKPHLFPRMLTSADCDKRKGANCSSCAFRNPDPDPDVSHCSFCHPWQNCPYEQQKFAALHSPLTVANFSYFLNEVNHVGRFSGRDLVVIDECDRLEPELMGHVEIYISPKLMQRLGIEPPQRKTVAASWDQWVHEDCMPAINKTMMRLRLAKSDALEAKRERKQLKQLYESLARVDLTNGNWVWSGYKEGKGDVRFKPVRVDEYGPEMLWEHARQFLLMSATVISPSDLAESVGIEDYAYVEMPSGFPPRRRPIYVRPVANMSHKANERDKLLAECVNICNEHPNERTLIHAVSYDLTKFLATNLPKHLTGRNVLWYDKSSKREEALARFRRSPGAVFVAPSMDRGVNLPSDECRVVIVAKIPFPNVGDKQVEARLHSRGGDSWYAVQTVRTLVQQLGRGMRSEEDYCFCYIVDEQFTSNVWKRSKHLIPRWIKESIDWYATRPIDDDMQRSRVIRQRARSK